MIGTSGLGIFIGSKIGEKMPDISIKIISSYSVYIFWYIKTIQLDSIIIIKLPLYIIYFILIIIYLHNIG